MEAAVKNGARRTHPDMDISRPLAPSAPAGEAKPHWGAESWSSAFRCGQAFQDMWMPEAEERSPSGPEWCRGDRGRKPSDTATTGSAPAAVPRFACRSRKFLLPWRSASDDSREAWRARAETAGCEAWRVPGY